LRTPSKPSVSPKARLSKAAVAGTCVAVLVTIVIVALPAPTMARAVKRPDARRELDDADATAAWLRIADDLKDSVPARILLGAAGPCDELESRLAEEGLDRAAFVRAAATVRREVARERDRSTKDAIVTSSQGVALPEGFQILEPSDAPVPERTSTLEAARGLLRELTEELRASRHSPDER
jgi:hypothetical protein